MTHCQRILALLGDGRWHDHHEIYGLSCVGHSRIAELRRRGHRIVMRREGALYLYRLVDGDGVVATRRPVDRRTAEPRLPSYAAVELEGSTRPVSVSVPVQLPLLPEQRGAYWEAA